MYKDEFGKTELDVKDIVKIGCLAVLFLFFFIVAFHIGRRLYRDCVTIHDGNWVEVTVKGIEKVGSSKHRCLKILFEYSKEGRTVSGFSIYESFLGDNLNSIRENDKIVVLISRWGDYMLYREKKSIIKNDVLGFVFFLFNSVLTLYKLIAKKKKQDDMNGEEEFED